VHTWRVTGHDLSLRKKTRLSCKVIGAFLFVKTF
jgi:hypothetical protein